MTTTAQKKSTPAPAKRLTAKQKADAAAAEAAAKAKAEQKPEPKAKAEPKAPALPTYREVEDFTPALKAAKAAAKGNADLTASLQLITHLAWKSPGGSVSWAKGTTPQVIAYADDIAVPEGTKIPDALAAALGIARKAVADEAQNTALSVLAKVIDGPTA